MKRKVLALLTASMMVFGLVACGGDTTADSGNAGAQAGTQAGADGGSGDLIKVGIINNDPNESGYRTANDKDMKEMFTEENGYEASFAYSLKNDERLQQLRSSFRTALTISFFLLLIQPDGILYYRMHRTQESV